ncbi:uncharacterized protein [Panulirus ornatus]|uniref:uncharacterized protein n=1 Tax=Panulirus ornatus TaxID=150431 RepID=UPI003A8AD9FE
MADAKVPLMAAVLLLLLCWAPVVARGAKSNRTLGSGVQLAAGKLTSSTALGPQVDREVGRVDHLDERDLATSENGTRDRSLTTVIFTVIPSTIHLGESVTATLRVVTINLGQAVWTIDFGDQSTHMTGAYTQTVVRSYTYVSVGVFRVQGKLKKHLQSPHIVTRVVTVKPPLTTKPTTTTSTTTSTTTRAPTEHPPHATCPSDCCCCHRRSEDNPHFAGYFLAFFIISLVILLIVLTINLVVFAITRDIVRVI